MKMFISMLVWSIIKSESSISSAVSDQALIERLSSKVPSGGATNSLAFWEDRGHMRYSYYVGLSLRGAPMHAKIALLVGIFTLLSQKQPLFCIFIVLVGITSSAVAENLSVKCLLGRNL